MSQFLRNIIYRHQVGGVNLEASNIVQPRPRSRFETDTNTGESLAQHELEIEPITKSTRKQSSPTPQISPQVSPHHQTESGQKAEQSDNQNLSISDELKPRIQTILQRLNSQKIQGDNKQSSTEFQQNIALSNTAAEIDKSTLTGSAELPFFSEQVLSFEHKGSENRPERQEAHRVGSLQIPNWLVEMQSNLNNRWQNSNTQSEAEPVVNVTIGRVEVRAVQTDSPTQPKPHNKPSGIMNLSDYLEQRNKGQS